MPFQKLLADTRKELLKNSNYLKMSYKMSADSESGKFDSENSDSEESLSPDKRPFLQECSDVPAAPDIGMVRAGEIFEREVQREKEKGTPTRMVTPEEKLSLSAKKEEKTIVQKFPQLKIQSDDDTIENKFRIQFNLESINANERQGVKTLITEGIINMLKEVKLEITFMEDGIHDKSNINPKVNVTCQSFKLDSEDRVEETYSEKQISDDENDETLLAMNSVLYITLKEGIKLPLKNNGDKYYLLQLGKDGLAHDKVIQVIQNNPNSDSIDVLRKIISLSEKKKIILNLYNWKQI